MTATTSAAHHHASRTDGHENDFPPKRQITWKDPWSFSTHAAGAVAAAVAGGFLIHAAPHEPGKLAVAIVYVASLVLLLGASAAYHFFDAGKTGNQVLRRLDHSAIFLLIAATYLAPLMGFLEGTWRIVMVSVILAIGLAGIVFKVTWFKAPRWLNTALYLAMGWFVVVPAAKIFPVMPSSLLAWLGAGGLAYTLGAVIYGVKKPNPWPGVFGFHEIWHLFVLAGAAAHFVFVWKTLLLPWP